MTSPPPQRSVSYFPKVERLFKRSDSDTPTQPRRPYKLAPVFDPDHADQPLARYDETQHILSYAEGTTAPLQTPLPSRPADFSSAYLFPSLARNERLRLTMTWYYTRGISEDEELLQKLRNIIKLVRTFIGWEFVIMGILSEDAYTRLTDGLSADKQAALSRFADILSAEIVNRSRINRQRQRQVMSDVLSRVKSWATQQTVEDLVKQALQEIYPDASISLQDSDDGTIQLENRPRILFSNAPDGLWEDSEFLEELVLSQNHKRFGSEQTVRAIIARCQKRPIPSYVVVSSKDVHLVFDDVDAWFVEACAVILFDFYHERLLTEALKAKETFLRGITHQLRTPIHGILGSVELLEEELHVSDIANGSTDGPDTSVHSVNSFTAKNTRLYLQSITNSGRELMSTVNNMLMLNRWAESSRSMKPASLYELNQLEADILRDISLMLPEEEISKTSVLFDNQLTFECSIVMIDIDLLKECLQSLILNAIQSTAKNGSVLVIITAMSDYSVLQFDVMDTGIGICKEDQRRIFEAYEKGDSHTRGVGLGLTISSKIANSMNGYVYLVSSEVGEGSHFRVEFRDPGFACPTNQCPYEPPAMKDLPKRYREVPTGKEATPLIRHFLNYLEHRGYVKSDTSADALNIVSFNNDEKQFQEHLKLVDPNAVCVCLIPSRANTKSLRLPSKYSKILFFEGPFLSTRLYDILRQVNEMCAKLKNQPVLQPISNGVPVGPNEQLHDVLARKLRILEPVSALLVDDNAINLRIFKLYCEKRQIPHALAVDGNEAVALYKSHMQTQPFNLILMDLQMPNCDGIEATKQIREIERSSNRHAAVIFMITGQDSPQDTLQSKEAGADEFFVKPMSMKTLDKGIAQYFGQQTQRDFPVG
ncbi:hypothetical protein SLS56_004335 [Neofusicoccum ribis]|uniref:histidine kinase n=1 Tax=Neofusicoccum ribis TaxID=45134 RepID=A0ABR3SWV9_9PEZI